MAAPTDDPEPFLERIQRNVQSNGLSNVKWPRFDSSTQNSMTYKPLQFDLLL
jgi:hypothetical protein